MKEMEISGKKNVPEPENATSTDEDILDETNKKSTNENINEEVKTFDDSCFKTPMLPQRLNICF